MDGMPVIRITVSRVFFAIFYLQKYAEAVVKVGVNLQPVQILVASIPTEYRELAVEITNSRALSDAGSQ